MFGDKCIELIKEVSRETTELIAPYNKQLVDEVINEMVTISQTLYESLNLQPNVESDSERNPLQYQNQLLVNKMYLRSFLWNKRCLLAYHQNRLERLKKIRWELGALLPIEVKQNISEEELHWFGDYSKNLSDYMCRLNDNKGIDLSLMRDPPKNLYIQVRCNTEFGPLDLDDGSTVVLSKDSMHYLPLSKCEKLIHLGILEQIK
ncbi:hypothetical protein RDWZM_001683 [Blomia tropicalis]|uniref:DNA replication complex GINS protein PSF1 n=1 Tax=Blomia tropicalis TaxID=40697 RepID=A0A9Q0MDI6_BLOTA|nr:hypothetical protein RDWZM_001683 [Blomia tropicalis]